MPETEREDEDIRRHEDECRGVRGLDQPATVLISDHVSGAPLNDHKTAENWIAPSHLIPGASLDGRRPATATTRARPMKAGDSKRGKRPMRNSRIRAEGSPGLCGGSIAYHADSFIRSVKSSFSLSRSTLPRSLLGRLSTMKTCLGIFANGRCASQWAMTPASVST